MCIMPPCHPPGGHTASPSVAHACWPRSPSCRRGSPAFAEHLNEVAPADVLQRGWQIAEPPPLVQPFPQVLRLTPLVELRLVRGWHVQVSCELAPVLDD